MKLDVALSNLGLRVVLRSGFRPFYSPKTLRRNFDFLAGVDAARLQKKYPKSSFKKRVLGGVDCEEISAAETVCENVILYFHGGGYFMGSIRTYRRNALRLSFRTGCRVILCDYPLAPEFPFPAALESSVGAYESLRKEEPEARVFFGGDSAGGGLVLATILWLRDHKRPLPSAAFCLSPWADLSASGKSIDENESKDVWLSRAFTVPWASLYAPQTKWREPYVSPVFGEFSDFPPLLLLVGDQEVLWDDAVRVKEGLERAGRSVEFVVGKKMQHNWPFSLPWLLESRRAMAAIADFVSRNASDK